MNTPISARDARKQRNRGAASTSAPIPLQADTPVVEVTGVRVVSDIPVVFVPSDEVTEMAEDAPTGVQETGVPEAEEDQAPGIEDDSPEGGERVRVPERDEVAGAAKKRKTPANRVPEGGALEKGRRRGKSRLLTSSVGKNPSLRHPCP